MNAAGRVVVRNLAFGVAGEAIAGALNFLTFILVARALGAAEFGVFSYILALVGVFQLLADFGVTNILMREIARQRERVAEIVGAARPLAWAASLIVFGIIAAIGWPLSPTREVYVSTLLLGLSVLATFHSFSYAAVCRAFEEMGYNALGNVTHKLLQIGLVAAALRSGTGVIGVGAAMLAANLYQWLFFHVVVRLRYVPKIRWRRDPVYWRYLLVEAVPIGLAMVFRRANQHIGTLVLTALSTSPSVGLFNAAYKVVQMIDMIPFTLSLPLFPPFSRLAQESHERLFALLTRTLSLFMILAAPIVMWVVVMAPLLMALMFGRDYTAAVPTLRLLSFALLFLFVTALYGYLFSALGRQRFFTISSACCLAANLVLDLALIPTYGHLGAASATLAAEAVFCASGAWLLYSIGYRLPLGRVVVAPLLLAAVVAAPLASIASASLALVALGSMLYGLVYLALIVVSGTLGREERSLILSFVLRRAPRPLAEAS